MRLPEGAQTVGIELVDQVVDRKGTRKAAEALAAYLFSEEAQQVFQYLRQMGELELPAIAWGINVEAQKDGFWQATAGKGNYVATLDTYAEVESTPKTIPFVKAFKARFGKSPTYTAATYDVIHVLKQVIEQTDSIDPDKLVPVIEKTEYVGTGAISSYDKRHDLIWAVGKTSGIAVEWQDGEKVPFWPPTTKGMKPFKLPKR